MKILLVALNGSYTHTNLAIRCLRRPLEENEFEVAFLERNLRDRTAHVLQDITEAHADIVGFSTYIWNCTAMYELASDLKKISPNTQIVFGGPEVSYETERFDDMDYIDHIVCGEGEQAFTNLCIAIRNGVKVPRIINALPYSDAMMGEGILYREGDYPAGAMLYYESSRGCPYSCAYCLSSATEGVRAKSVGQIEKDLLEFEKLPQNIKIIKFVDRTFNYSAKRANEIWTMLLEERFTKHYHFEVCASLLSEENFQVLKRFPKGKIQLEFGLQSTNPDTLGAVCRHIDPTAVLKAVGRIKEMGNIHVHLDLIAGLPYERFNRFCQSFNEAFPHCHLLQLGFLKLLPGTALRRDAEKYGIVYSDKPPYAVLSTNWIKYEEIVILEEVDEILERLCESGHFERSLGLIFENTHDYFGFFEGFSSFIKKNDGRRVQKIAQADLFRLFYNYSRELISPADLPRFDDAIHKDYTSCENRKFKVNIND